MNRIMAPEFDIVPLDIGDAGNATCHPQLTRIHLIPYAGVEQVIQFQAFASAKGAVAASLKAK